MLGRMSRKARLVVREKSSEDAPLCRMFCPNFKGKVAVLPCEDGEERFNVTIHDNFRVPAQAVLEVELSPGKGNLGALGDPDGTGVPKQHLEKHGDKKFRRAKKPHEPVVIPPLVPEVAGGGAAAGGSSAGSKIADDKKRKGGDASAACWQKGPKLRRTRTAAISQPKPVVVTEPREETFSFFDAPSSPLRDAAVDVEVHKEGRRSPSIEVVTSPSVHAEDTGKKAAGQPIADTLDSSNHLIDPHDSEVQGRETEVSWC
ncbi:hypothetical protein Hanom_Chr12g01125381 [Helianthus anomalus]